MKFIDYAHLNTQPTDQILLEALTASLIFLLPALFLFTMALS